MSVSAVLTGDIVNSTKLGLVKEKKLLKMLTEVATPDQFEFYRGDSFQVYKKNPAGALKTALLCRTGAIKLSEQSNGAAPDVRISIGIGQVITPVKTLSTAKGEAFVLSGRAFDEIAKTDQRLVISSSNALVNHGLEVMADYINALFKIMTQKQAMVIFELLTGETQKTVAEKLGKSKSTIHQHVSSGHWPEIEKLLQQYVHIINQLP